MYWCGRVDDSIKRMGRRVQLEEVDWVCAVVVVALCSGLMVVLCSGWGGFVQWFCGVFDDGVLEWLWWFCSKFALCLMDRCEDSVRCSNHWLKALFQATC